ncbi:MAG TPA: DUF3237 domain-containing protein [Candidatus Cybelea sp.]|nr:DUF3237 domain-containing protein [Candidatus Cybelea sp.]
MPRSHMEPGLEFLLEARVRVEPALELGEVPRGRRRIIPIAGGTFEGPKLRGVVVPGGADWQIVRPDGLAELTARYTLQTDDGALIFVVNRGVRHGPAEVVAKLMRGEPVDSASYYFRTTPTFETGSRKYDWLNRHVFVAVGERHPAEVAIRMYQVT